MICEPEKGTTRRAPANSDRLLAVSRNYAGQEDCECVIVVSTTKNFKHDIFTGFQLADCRLVVLHRGHWRAIDFGDDVAAAKAEVVRKARGIDINHKNAALAIHADTRCAIGRKAFDAEAKFSRRRLTRLIAYATRLGWENVRTIFD